MIDLAGKNVVVVGLGLSGIAAARLLLARGARVTGTDSKSRAAIHADALALEREGVSLALSGHADAKIESADLVVVSPGVPMFAELRNAEKKGVSIISEIELATRALKHDAPIVAIGGTNGKSTVTSLVGALLADAGKKVFTGGNLGEPLAAHVDEAFDVVVLEVSSFQLERLDTFKPHVSALLNVTADHLDRYPDMSAYAHAKGNAFVKQTASDVAVIPANDDICLAQAKRGGGRIVTFGAGGDVDVRESDIVDVRSGFSIARSAVRLRGGHNALNVAASLAVVAPFAIEHAAIKKTLATFSGLPHRMAFVREISGVRYYDDSKGTNVGAVVTALSGLDEKKCVLIAGGKDKGGGYAPLLAPLREKGRAVVVMGEAADAIERELSSLGGEIKIVHATTMADAVQKSALLAEHGDAVLLSPACSSFDMFRDYKHRGDEFVSAVNALEKKS